MELYAGHLIVTFLVFINGVYCGEECYNAHFDRTEWCRFGCCEYEYYTGVTCCQEVGAILGIVFGILAILCIIIIVVWCKLKQMARRARKVSSKAAVKSKTAEEGIQIENQVPKHDNKRLTKDSSIPWTRNNASVYPESSSSISASRYYNPAAADTPTSSKAGTELYIGNRPSQRGLQYYEEFDNGDSPTPCSEESSQYTRSNSKSSSEEDIT